MSIMVPLVPVIVICFGCWMIGYGMGMAERGKKKP